MMTTLMTAQMLMDAGVPGPWSGLRVLGYCSGSGGPRSYEAQLCNSGGRAVFIVNHDSSPEGHASVALAALAPELLALVRGHEARIAKLEAALTEIADVDKRRAEFVAEGPRGFARMCALARAALETKS